jgi:hypothetical protein
MRDKKNRLPAHTIPALRCGLCARQILQQRGFTEIAGLSSRGVYLYPPVDGVLFLSLERYAGPLTVNLPPDQFPFSFIKPGGDVLLDPEWIHFPEENIQITLKGTPLWVPPKPTSEPDLDNLPTQLAAAVHRIRCTGEGYPYQSLLTSLLPGNPIQIPDLPEMEQDLSRYLAALEERNLGQAMKHLTSLLGLGSGLTPLGDDFVLGVLLTLNRWGRVFNIDQNLEAPNQTLCQSAQEKTTRLSASLLTCAAAGAADERLLSALDGFFTDGRSMTQEVENVLTWGSSSGMAALAGMLSVLTRLLK